MPKKHPDDHYFDEYDARAYRHLVHREEHSGNGQNPKKEKKRKQKKQKSHKKSREKQESNQEVKNVNKSIVAYDDIFSAFQTFNTCCTTINYIPELTPLATNISQDVASKNAFNLD
jgi:hypothetical protein